MLYSVYLIDQPYVISSSTLFNNVEWKMIKNSLNESHKYVLNVIGSGLMVELQNQSIASAFTSTNQYILDEFIKPMLVNYLLYESIEFIHYNLSPTGIQVFTPNESQPASERGLDRIKDAHRKRAEGIADDLRKYLLQNAEQYPLFNNPGNGYDTVHPQTNNYFCGMYLDDVPNYSVNKDRNV